MGLLSTISGRRNSNASERSEDGKDKDGSTNGQGQDDIVDPNDTEVLDKEEGNLLMSLISQLRIGMDLSKIAFPTFVLEPRSLLERITDFMAHPEFIFGVGTNPDAEARFLKTLTFYLAGWHIKPKGVKKPYNPVLGEFFRCTYQYADGSKGIYVAEQVSHHPPVSAFFYVSPKNGVLITGEIKPRSRFLGNSAATLMDGENRITLLQRPEDGEYSITMPNMYARGIVVGKMTLELGDTSTVVCRNTGMSCDIEFKTKGWISGGYNVVTGHVKSQGKDIGEINGHWHSSMEYKEYATSRKETLFDVATAKIVPKTVLPENEQEPYESRRLWSGLTKAIKNSDMYAATEEKTKIEEYQRELARQREATGEQHQMRFFKAVGQKFMPKLDIDPSMDPTLMEQMVCEWVFGKSGAGTQDPSSTTPNVANNINATHATTAPGAINATNDTDPTNIPLAYNPSIRSQSPTLSMHSATSGVSIPAVALPTAPGPPAPGPKLSVPPPIAK